MVTLIKKTTKDQQLNNNFWTDEAKKVVHEASLAKDTTDVLAVSLYKALGGDLRGKKPSERLDALPKPGTKEGEHEGNNLDKRKVEIPTKKGNKRTVFLSEYLRLIRMTPEGQKLQAQLDKHAGKKGSGIGALRTKSNNRMNYLVKGLKNVYYLNDNLKTINEIDGLEAFVLRKGQSDEPVKSPKCIVVRSQDEPEKLMSIQQFCNLKPRERKEDTLKAVIATSGRGADDDTVKGMNIANVNVLEDVMLGIATYMSFDAEDRYKNMANLDPTKEDDREVLKAWGELAEVVEKAFDNEDFAKKVQQAAEYEDAQSGDVEEETSDEDEEQEAAVA